MPFLYLFIGGRGLSKSQKQILIDPKHGMSGTKWNQLNIIGKLNVIFFITNLFCALHSAALGLATWILHFIVSFFCFISYKYSPVCHK
tara:strand:+ start:490 stop:753 length:264 start_codon:yes stop_codon:yes gene_type:complete